ncbi:MULTISPECIES: hypothetical protein [unclassified Gilliamella]|uniref:hypothetical protein n=1 Tax=unclassified Gilliamella TaxID=2685620 RepID=UPI0018DB7C3F|nr:MULTISPECIES: hypothetical protein [unclassified Gilliamella]MBI0114402.1 hypothetical protein [Gilliamella sp. W8123]MBI0118229.1 hypothetical protein [Gilliamella sp. W8129]MBI0155129.1 hypothetical protein [Gilliamella sp. W8128]
MPYSYSGIVKDIIREHEKMKERNTYVIPPSDISEEYERKIKKMGNQIASYELNIQNDIEVIYNLLFQRDFLLIAINQFLTKTDHQTKQFFINFLNEVKSEKEADEQYKQKFKNWVYQQNFSEKLIWEVKNPDKIKHNPVLNFPDFQ